jgi:hypothetical protein
VRFLPRFDNALLSHADQVRIVSDEYRKRLIASGGMGSVGTVLVDGFVGGTWKTQRARGEVTQEIEPFEALSRKHRDAVADEGERFVRFIARPEATEAYGVRFVETN